MSPGPCTPNEAVVSLELVATLGPRVPILGVCLGHQAIGQVYGGRVVRAGRIMHGKTSAIRHEGKGVFAGLPDGYEATRYHSRVGGKVSLPGCLEVTAWAENDDASGEEYMDTRLGRTGRPARTARPDPWRVPGSPGDRPGVRRARGTRGKDHARQDLGDPA